MGYSVQNLIRLVLAACKHDARGAHRRCRQRASAMFGVRFGEVELVISR